MRRERCSVEPDSSPTYRSMGRTERAPETGARGPPHPVPSAQPGERRSPHHPRSPGQRNPGPDAGYGGERGRETVVPAHARGHREAAFYVKGNK